MFKKAIIAAAAALSIGGAMAATSANAEPWHEGGFHGGGWHEGWRGGGWREGWHGGYGWRAPVVFVGPGRGYYGGCGWRWSPYWGHYVRACR